MQVDNLLIEAFEMAADETITARAILCRFDRPSYVGVRRSESETRIGPAKIIDPQTHYEKERFPDRSIPIERGRRSVFSYREPWTVPPWTLYLLAPPPGYYASPLLVQPFDEARQVSVRAASDEGHLFYFALFQGSGERIAFETEGRFKYDPSAADRAMDRAGHVSGMRWGGIFASITEPLSVAGEVVSVAAAIKILIS